MPIHFVQQLLIPSFVLYRVYQTHRDSQPCLENKEAVLLKKISGCVLDSYSLRMLEDRKDILSPFSLIVHNSKPVGHQVISNP